VTFLFGRCQVLGGTRQLFVDGQPREIGGRAFQLLLALIESRGSVISKSQIIGRVWPGARMDEANLRVQISAVRKALGEDRDIVKTVPGQGYLFAADVTVASWPAGPPDLAVAVPMAPEPAAKPRPPSPGQPETNLPYSFGALIGRAIELAELCEQLAHARLVTLVGAGGIGKTRLAIELGWAVSEQFPGGVRMVSLAPIVDTSVVMGTIASALGVALPDAEAPIETIADAIGKKRTLLIVDNCEHLVETVAGLISALLERVPNLSVLATSQGSLRIAAEQIYRLSPLGLPPQGPADAEADPGNIADFGAIELFVERARAADRRFELHAGNVADVAKICRCLDGIPLALEMAAARLPVLGLEALCAGLGERLRMLKANPRAGERRHRTLSAMVEWSHSLLDMAERQVFRRLSIFAGSFSLAAVIAVAGENDDRWDVIDILDRLIDKSLVVVEDAQPPRYRLLETLRVYGADRLQAAGESVATADRHERYFTDLSDRAHEQWETTPDAAWVEAYRPELDNVRAALNWALTDRRNPQAAVSLMGSFAIVWYNLGLVSEGRRYAEQVLAVVGKDPSPAAARFFRFVSYFWDIADRQRSLALLERSAAVYRQLNDRLDLAPVLATIGRLHAGFHRDAEARVALGEAQAMLGSEDRKKSRFSIAAALSSIAYNKAERVEALGHLADALHLAHELKDSVREANVLTNIAELEFATGAVDRAIERAREALGVMRATGRRTQREWALINLASYLIARGDLAEARSLAAEAFSSARHYGGLIVRACLRQWALLGALGGRCEEAAQLLGFIDGGHADLGEVLEPTEQKTHDYLLSVLEARLSAPRISALAAEGARWSERRAVDFADGRLVSRHQEHRPSPEAAAHFARGGGNLEPVDVG
jgi:predicted ATPase/DNA-binding winged helix-turn-helix (wHTH) protein